MGTQTAKFMPPAVAKRPVESQIKGRREMMAGTFGLAAAAAAKDRTAMAAEAAPTKKDGRAALLALPPAVALGWVGFNILGPALNQVDNMQDRADAVKSGKKR